MMALLSENKIWAALKDVAGETARRVALGATLFAVMGLGVALGGFALTWPLILYKWLYGKVPIPVTTPADLVALVSFGAWVAFAYLFLLLAARRGLFDAGERLKAARDRSGER